jgi:hypothetical protein
VLTVAIACGVLAYVYERSHAKLSITSVSVTTPDTSVGCNGKANLVGTITTNGRGGPISYEWVTTGNPKPQVLTAADESGKDTVVVRLGWTFHGKGTGNAVAELRVLSPGQAKSSVIFPYSGCPS